MNINKLEKEVIKNSLAVEKIMPDLMKKHEGEYIVYNRGETYFTKDLREGVNLGIKKFGEKAGFAVMKVTQDPIILCSLVRYN